jgi:hypothetical protein
VGDATGRFADFEQGITLAVESADSLEDVEQWLNTRSDVKSVELDAAWRKSNPPQRTFRLVLQEADNGPPVAATVSVFVEPTGSVQFGSVWINGS